MLIVFFVQNILDLNIVLLPNERDELCLVVDLVQHAGLHHVTLTLPRPVLATELQPGLGLSELKQFTALIQIYLSSDFTHICLSKGDELDLQLVPEMLPGGGQLAADEGDAVRTEALVVNT